MTLPRPRAPLLSAGERERDAGGARGVGRGGEARGAGPLPRDGARAGLPQHAPRPRVRRPLPGKRACEKRHVTLLDA